MKKAIITISLFVVCQVVTLAQSYNIDGDYKISDRLGIGTTSPLAKLHISNGDYSYGSILAQANESSFQLYTKTIRTQPVDVESFRIGLKHGINENNGFISFYRGGSSVGGFLGFSTNGIERILIDGSGRIGIGTNSPISALDVNGVITLQGDHEHTIKKGLLNGAEATEITGRNVELYAFDDILLRAGTADKITFQTGGYERLRILSNGNLGIGTTSPDYKLDVVGTIRAQELKVDMQGADFVFEDDYKLRSLNEVEAFVKENKHLPEIAPATEMQANGVNQSEMNQKLLQKIEELTLYTIEQEKELVKKEDDMNELKKNLVLEITAREKLEKRFSKLELLVLKK